MVLPPLAGSENFSQCQPVNRRALFAESSFELRFRKDYIIEIDNFKLRMRAAEPLDLLKIFELIGRHMQKAVFFQRRSD